jgi:outer membrane protein OmpU
MNKLKKIGVSALAGSLVAISANAADWNVSGSAGFAVNSLNEGKLATSWYQYDSVVISASGQTEGGINVSAMFELDGGGNASTTSSYDDRMMSFGTDQLGTIEYWGHGGSSVMGAFDDVTPKAHEEVWDIGSQDGTTAAVEAADSMISGGAGNHLINYISPSIAGATIMASYSTGTAQDHYSDYGFKYSPEMVEGLTLYYAAGTTTSGVTDTDESTMAVTYSYGPVTVGYQESESDQANNADDDESESWSIAYAITDDLTVSYGERDYDHNTSDSTSNNALTQKDSGFGISYTMGGVSFYGSMNEHDNVLGSTAATHDIESYDFGVSFAF